MHEGRGWNTGAAYHPPPPPGRSSQAAKWYNMDGCLSKIIMISNGWMPTGYSISKGGLELNNVWDSIQMNTGKYEKLSEERE